MTLPFLTPLDPETQRSAGIDPPQTLAVADRVRYGELDPLNHVNNKAYFGWFETMRVEYWTHMCAPFCPTYPRLVLRNADIRFLQEMLAGEDYIATASVSAYRRTSFTIHQQIWSAGSLRATLSGVMVTLSPDGKERAALPDALCEAFRSRDGATPQS